MLEGKRGWVDERFGVDHMAIRKNSRDGERNDIKSDLLENLGEPGRHIERIYGTR